METKFMGIMMIDRFRKSGDGVTGEQFRSGLWPTLLLPLLLIFLNFSTQVQTADDNSKTSVTIFPVYEKHFVSSEHPAGTEDTLGDQLGRDFIIMGFNQKGLPVAYENEGTRNEDWFSWREKVLAPIDGKVSGIRINETTNEPGQPGEPPASNIVFEREDGVKVLYAHVREIEVEEGDFVEAGDVVGRVGNNGVSFMPHIHVGAWKDEQPLQIQVDLEKMGEIMDPQYMSDQ